MDIAGASLKAGHQLVNEVRITIEERLTAVKLCKLKR